MADPQDTIVILAGKKYFEQLLPLIQDFNVVLPLKGLVGQGEQNRWLKNSLKKVLAHRMNELDEFYNQILGCIKTYGLFILKDTDGYHPWPKQGVYFFFDPSEPTPTGLPGRIVRIGSHGVARNTKSTLWGRLKQHQGSQKNGGGNHRCSIFRLHVGSAIEVMPPRWLDRKAKNAEVGHLEHTHERLVSEYIRQLPFTIIEIPGLPGKDCLRAVFESECIAYLSWAEQKGLIKIGENWLGLRAANDKIKASGLWNVDEVWGQGQPQPKVPTWPSVNLTQANILGIAQRGR